MVLLSLPICLILINYNVKRRFGSVVRIQSRMHVDADELFQCKRYQAGRWGEVRVKLGGLTAVVGSGVCLTEVVRGVCEQEIS